MNEVIQAPDYEFKSMVHHKESFQEFLRDKTELVFRELRGIVQEIDKRLWNVNRESNPEVFKDIELRITKHVATYQLLQPLKITFKVISDENALESSKLGKGLGLKRKATTSFNKEK